VWAQLLITHTEIDESNAQRYGCLIASTSTEWRMAPGCEYIPLNACGIMLPYPRTTRFARKPQLHHQLL
jgi:hypothetical protein